MILTSRRSAIIGVLLYNIIIISRLLAADCAIEGHHIKDERYPKFEESLYAVQVLMCRPYHTKITTLDVEDI
jgi:hypothetical protein